MKIKRAANKLLRCILILLSSFSVLLLASCAGNPEFKQYKALTKQATSAPESVDYARLYQQYLKTINAGSISGYGSTLRKLIKSFVAGESCENIVPKMSELLENHFLSLTAHYIAMQCYGRLNNAQLAGYHEKVISNILPVMTVNGDGSDSRKAIKVISLVDASAFIQLLDQQELDSILKLTKSGQSLVYAVLVNDFKNNKQQYIYFENTDIVDRIMVNVDPEFSNLKGLGATLAAASQGESSAQLTIGDWLQGQRYLPNTSEEILNYYKSAYVSGSVIAHTRLATEHLLKGNEEGYEHAIGYLLPAVERGYASAEIMLAGLYLYGIGLEADKEASDLLLASAKQKIGDDKAEFELAEFLDKYIDEKLAGEDIKKLLFKTAKSGYIPAINRLARVYSNNEEYKSARQWYLKSAEMGDAEAQTNLGQLYYWGKGIKQDYMQAIVWLKKAADQSHANGQYWLARIYDEGKSAQHSIKQAIHWYTKAAENGNLYAQAELGWLYEGGEHVHKDYSKSFYWYKLSAMQGYDYSENKIGYFYEEGYGVARNIKLAAQWYFRAAIKSNDYAATNLGWLFESGELEGKNYEQAAFWYSKAAENGFARAQTHLAWLYEKGRGVEKDYEQAVYWYRKAAGNDYSRAQNNLGWCYDKGYGIEKDLKKAVYWYQKSAENGYATAQNNLAWSYEHGEGVDVDYSLAVYWYKESAKQGLALAENNLGRMYEMGNGLEKNINQAAEWYLKAANKGDKYAQSNLASLYESGQLGRANNIKKAIYWYTKSAEQNHATAQMGLSTIYARKGDSAKANYWLSKAKENGYEEDDIEYTLEEVDIDDISSDAVVKCIVRDNDNKDRSLSNDQTVCGDQYTVLSAQYEQCMRNKGWSKASLVMCSELED